jgi:hypothetical protein
MVSFTPRPIYPQGKSPRYQMDWKPGGSPIHLHGVVFNWLSTGTNLPYPAMASVRRVVWRRREGSGKKQLSRDRGNIPAFALRVWRKPRKPPVSTPGDKNEVRTSHYLNTNRFHILLKTISNVSELSTQSRTFALNVTTHMCSYE